MKTKPSLPITPCFSPRILPLLFGACLAAQAAPTGWWTADGDGGWTTPGNWDSGTVPNEPKATALFTNNITALRTVTLDAAVTLGTLQVGSQDGANNFVLSGTGLLTFDNDGLGAQLLSPTGNDADAVNSPVVLTENLTVNSGKKITLGGVISESVAGRSITKQGTGTLVLASANTYRGGVVINGGTVQINAETALGAAPAAPTPGNVTINGGTLALNTSAILVKNRGIFLGAGDATIDCSSTAAGIYGVIEGPGRMVKTGSRTLFLATNLYAGGTWLKEGALKLGSASPAWSQLGSGDLTIENGTSLYAWTTTARTVTNRVVVNGGLTLGATTTDTGALTLSGPVDLGAGSRTLTTVSGQSSTISGVVSDAGGGLVKAGSGTLTLMAANTFSGGVVLSEGTLRIGNHNALGSGTLTIEAGTTFASDSASNRQPPNNVIIHGDFTLGQPSGGNGTVYLRGDVDLGSAMRAITLGNTVGNYITGTISGTGGVVLKDPNVRGLNVYGANTFSGGVTIVNGQIAFLGDSAFGTGVITLGDSLSSTNVIITGQGTVANNIVVVAGGPGNRTLTATNYSATVYSGSITLGADLTLGIASSSSPRTVSLTGPVSGPGSLRVAAGTPIRCVVSGANSYAGSTLIAAGTFVAANTTGSATSTGAVTVQASATLAGTGTLAGPVTLSAKAMLAPGVDGIGVLTFLDTLSLASTSTNVMELNKSLGTNDMVVANIVNYDGTLLVTNLAGTLAAGDSFKLFSATAHSGTFANVVLLNSTLKTQFDPATGVLSLASDIASTPTNITFTVSGANLSLTWPESHKGWFAQSNSIGLAAPNAWYDIAGSDSGTNLNVTINPALPQVYFRLRQP
jgi:fibronectin-binding autotransporter adhesin